MFKNLSLEDNLKLVLENLDEKYMFWMNKVEENPDQAIIDFRNKLGKPKNKKQLELIHQVDGIISNNSAFWQHSAKTKKDAVQFIISNTIMSGGKLGAL